MTSTNHKLLPRHVAIIMDGNGRWAKKRGMPRAAGHKSGVIALRKIVEHSVERNIGVLSVYAFSSENWGRPEEEVSILMELFISSLRKEVKDLHANKVHLKFIGDRSAFSNKLQDAIFEAEALTSVNDGLVLAIAVNYGGRWDLTSACRKIAASVHGGELKLEDISEKLISRYLSLEGLPDPDLFIRTGGEKRFSNFLLWQLAYSEIYFTDVLWPDFSLDYFDQALAWFSDRQRRFGRTSEQVIRAGRA